MLNVVHRSLHYLASTCSFILTSCHPSPCSLYVTQCPCSCYTLWPECPSYFIGLANSTQYLGIQLKNILLETVSELHILSALSVRKYPVHLSLLALTILKFSVPVYMCLSPPPLPLPTPGAFDCLLNSQRPDPGTARLIDSLFSQCNWWCTDICSSISRFVNSENKNNRSIFLFPSSLKTS